MPDNIISGKVVLNTESLTAGGELTEKTLQTIGDAAVRSSFFLQSFTDASIQSAVSQEQLAAAAAAAAASIPKIIPPAESAGVSLRQLWETAKETGLGIKEAMSESAEAVTRFAETTRLGTANAVSSFSALGAVLGGAAIVGVLGEMIDKAKENAVGMKQLSEATGVEIETLVGLRQEMIETDTPVQNLNQTMSRLAGAMAESRDPSTKQAEAFRELGVSTAGWSKELPPTIDVLQQLAHHLANSTNESADLGNAKLVLGRNIVQLVAMLKAEGDGLSENIDKHRSLAEAVKGSVESGESLQQTEARIAEKFNTLTANVLPGVIYSFNLVSNGIERLVEITAIVATEVGFFGEVAKISFTAAYNYMRGVTLEALAIAEAMRGNVPAALALQKGAVDAANEAKNGLKELKSNYLDTAVEVTAIAKKTQKDISDIWAKPIEVKGKGEGTDNQDFQNKKLMDKQRSAQDEQLTSKQAHDVEMLNAERAFLEGQEKIGNISEENRENQLKDILGREMAIRIDYANQRIALYANDPDSVDKVARLEAEKVAAIDKAGGARVSADAKIGEARKKSEDEETKFTAFVAKEAEKRPVFEEPWLKASQDNNSLRNLTIAADRFHANQLLEVAEQEHQIRMLKLQEDETLATLRLQTNSEAQQIATIKKFDSEISAAESRLASLKASQENPDLTDSHTKDADNKIAAQRRADEQAKSTADKIEGVNKQTEKSFDRVTRTISNQFGQATADVLRGTQSIGGAFMQMAGKMATDLETSLARMAVRWALHYAQHLIMHTSTNAAIVTSDAAAASASTGITAAQSFKQVMHFAAVAAAKAYASLADIPVVGPALGAAAAAATFVGVLAFQSLISAEKGAVLGNGSSLAMLHPREMVLPAHLSEGIQNMIGGKSGQSSDSGQSKQHSPTLHYYAPPNVSREDMARHAKEMIKLLNKNMRKGRTILGTT